MGVKKQTFYEILGVEPSVNYLEIKLAYRRLVKSHHPDVWPIFNAKQRDSANEKMRKLNEAYEILKDKKKRAEYDSLIGLSRRSLHGVKQAQMVNPADTDEACEQYLRQIFYPARNKITRLLNQYKQQLIILSQDIYDERLVETFEEYGNDIEEALAKASQALSSRQTPRTLRAAELMMRYAIAQTFDGLEELKCFCQNYDYSHLTMAENLFKGANDLSRKALQLAKQR